MAHPKLSKPDLEDLIFCQRGEFSVEADLRFQAHLKRLEIIKNRAVRAIKNPRRRIRSIVHQEPLWYGMAY